jgi:uncharacterized membrane protein HdeD (DUF308 family)
VDKGLKKAGINVSKPILAVLCILFGLSLFIWPQLVDYIIGLFLIIQGIILLVEYYDNGGRKKYKRHHHSSESSMY